jgi:hypothetical protein
MVLSDVLKAGAGQHRQTEFDVEDDEQHAGNVAPDASFSKIVRISVTIRGEGWSGVVTLMSTSRMRREEDRLVENTAELFGLGHRR